MNDFIQLLILFFLIGIGPTLHFQPFLKGRGIVHFISIPITIGIILLFLITLSIGHLGIPIMGRNLQIIKIFCLFTSLILLILNRKKIRISQLLQRPNPTDIFATLVLGLFFYILFQISQKHYFAPWDHFSYWLLDTKIIIETNKLKNNLDLTRLSYSSFYPLHAALFFNSLGQIKEQFASFITIFYAIQTNIIAYSFSHKKNNIIKLMTLASLIIVDFAIYKQMLTFYAELVNIFYITFFVFLLLKKTTTKTYHQKFFLMLLVQIIICYIKPTNIFYVFTLTLVWIIYDFKELKIELSHIRKNKKRLIPFLFFVCIVACRYYYTHQIYVTQSFTKKLLDLTEIPSIASIVKNIISLIQQIFNHYRSTAFVLIFSILSQKNWTKKKLALIILALSLPAINILHYSIGNGMSNSSIFRYVTTTFFLIPILITHTTKKNETNC